MSKIRRINASNYDYDDPRRYILTEDCLSEPEVLKAYCRDHPKAVCLGGYGYYGCLPVGKKRQEYIRYDYDRKCYIRIDGKIVEINETYCGRKIPRRTWRGRDYLENRIWALAGFGIPDLIDGDLVIEAKGELPTSQKVRTALGQLLFYKEHDERFSLGFLFPRIWLEAENIQNDLNIFRKFGITLLPVWDFMCAKSDLAHNLNC